MNLVLYAQIAVAGIAFATALLHGVLSFRHEAKSLHRFFALFSLGAAGEAVTTAWRYRTTNPEDLVTAARWGYSFQFLFVISLLWFITEYVNRDRAKFLQALTAGLFGIAIINLTEPFSILFQQLPSLETIRLSWGEPITVPAAKRNHFFPVMNIVVLMAAIYVVSSCISLWRKGELDKAKAITFALAPLVTIAYPQGLLINWGILKPPYLYSFSYLALVMMMSFHLIRDSTQAAALSRQIRVNEHRWRTLLENVNLLVIGLDRDGLFSYVNPHFLATTGYAREDLVGQSIQLILPTEEAPKAARRYQLIMQGLDRLNAQVVSRILRKDGAVRTVQWSNVPIVGERNEISGVLSIGVDTTELERAEAARDEALVALEKSRRRLEAENLYLREEVLAGPGSQTIIGEGVSVRYVLHKIREVAGTDATVLIQGETGVGKELVAQAIHQASARAAGPYIRVNCAALPPALIESELFGHERGAFTGADKLRRGRFELAEGGTFLLDEVGELPLDVQVKLLRVLQEGEYERVGSSQTRKANVRIIAATNRDLAVEVSAGRFREDLYYRLQVYPITVPPLRERREDIPLLVRTFVQRYARQHGRQIQEVPGHVLELLSEQDWPGNIRELENVIERAVISSPGPNLRLPPGMLKKSETDAGSSTSCLESMEGVERKHILRVLASTGWKISGSGGAAQILGLHPNTLRSRMAKLEIRRPDSANQGVA